ncbi:hypothetical protein L1987_22010 [Smallanthus sonchifolius]|uniref:Uncharacterized protein n=1 Tax=Smallanthus sonchifolius TaxID=185202 RepID=A0ACB9IF03_9ASTR|nr:hypothetical protein L1987_22010 [Smallanthus sonchifolius]
MAAICSTSVRSFPPSLTSMENDLVRLNFNSLDGFLSHPCSKGIFSHACFIDLDLLLCEDLGDVEVPTVKLCYCSICLTFLAFVVTSKYAYANVYDEYVIHPFLQHVEELLEYEAGCTPFLGPHIALGRHKLRAAAANLVEGEKPADVYSGIAARVIEIMRRDAEGDTLTDQNAKHTRLLVDECSKGRSSLPIKFRAPAILNGSIGSLTPEKAIPDAILRHSNGLAKLTIVKVGMMVTYKIWTGLVIARREDGLWSPPFAILSLGVGLGAQDGGEFADLIIVLRSEEAVKTFSSDVHASFGVGLSDALGVIGRTADVDVRA